MAKQLKPGQLCTINGHVLRCKRELTEFKSFQSFANQTCENCRVANNNDCVMSSILDNITKGSFRCQKLFGTFYYPILVK